MKMTRSIAALAGAAVTITLALSGCGGDASANKNTNPSVKTIAAGTLTVGSDLTYPPYDMLTDGKPAGFDVDVMNAVAEELGLTPKFNDTRFAQIVAGIKANRYDVIASTLYISASRAKEVDFVPYFQTGNSIISPVNGSAFATPQDLCGKTVGIVTATVIAKILPGQESDKCKAAGKPAISVKEFPTDPEASQALFAGQVDAQMTDAAVAKTVVDKSNGRLHITSTSVIYPIAVGLGVQKGNTEMKTALEKTIDSLTKSGKLAELAKKYNIEPADPAVVAESLKQG